MFFLIALLPFFSLFGAFIGNPSMPALLEEGFFISDRCWSNPQVGFSYDFLLQKTLRPCHHCSSSKESKIWGNSQVGEIIWNIRERFNLGARLGSARAEWQWMQQGQKFGGRGGVFLWSGDAKLILLEVKDTSFATDVSGGGWDGARLKLRYWQVNLALTQKFRFFAPYLGCSFNQTRVNICSSSAGLARFFSKRIAGPFIGCSVSNGAYVLLNGEWRGWFEEGVTLSAQVRF
ncbi:MAG: hypothetical protein V4487_02285 [Chlamydiota bacterium]